MACNSCSKPFSLLRPEKGCPGCGFSFCSKCLKEKVFLSQQNSEAKVCAKCKVISDSNEPKTYYPPDAYYKRATALDGDSGKLNTTDQQILDRLKKLKKGNQRCSDHAPSTSDAEIQRRLANIKGVPAVSMQRKPLLPSLDKSDQEQVDALMKQFVEQSKLDSKYNDEFDGVIRDIEMRLRNLKSSSNAEAKPDVEKKSVSKSISETRELECKENNNIITKLKMERVLEDTEPEDDTGTKELPFCEICNENAKMRCLGCKYLFCKKCFMEHKDDDDGCNRFERYSPTKK